MDTARAPRSNDRSNRRSNHGHGHGHGPGRARATLAVVASAVACAPGGRGPHVRDGGPAACVAGDQRCDGNTLEACVDGAYAPVTECAGECSPTRGCTLCTPGARACIGDTATVCRPDGSGRDVVLCDPVQGMRCELGECVGACAPQSLDASYIGCEYFPTVTAQLVSNRFAFAVAVANASTATAQITIEDGALPSPIAFAVPPGAVQVQELPWVPVLKACTGNGTDVCTSPDRFETKRATRGAYHLRSTRPVTVYQFSPLDYQRDELLSYSNDASLLLPTNVLTGSYVVTAWQASELPRSPGFLAVTAVQDGTFVTITPTAASAASATSPGSPGFAAGEPTTVTMSRGDVIELLNVDGDLTGSVVTADRPVQVVSGHYCTNVPDDVPFCDHLEDSMFPVETLGTEYAVTAPAVPGLPDGKEQVIRIVATQPDTTLTFEPDIPGAQTAIADAGGVVEIARHAGDFVVRANHKVVVAHYMEGQDAGGQTGDPAMTLAVSTNQYRTAYAFHAPRNYEVNYVNVTAPLGATVTVDGAPIPTPTPIGVSGLGVARVPLTAGPAGDGNHHASGDAPFGVTVYGYGQYTSYWYPGGLDLAEIIIE